MRVGLVLLVLCGLLAASSAAWCATTCYVGGPGASDSNPGSSGSPWATLQHAVDTIAAGDTILVRPGTYVGCRIGNSGSPGAVKTLASEFPGSALVNAAGPGNRHGSNIEVELFDSTVSYWVIDGFEVVNSTHWGIDVRVTQYVTVRNCIVHNSTITGIFLAFADYSLIENNYSYSNGEHGIYNSNSADHVTIRGNRSLVNYGCGNHNNGDISMGGDGIISYETIEGNTFWDNGVGGGSAINCDGVSDSIIRNNLIYGNHASGISLYGGDAAECSSRDKVYNNTVIQPSDGRWAINIPSTQGPAANGTANVLANNILYTYHSFRGTITIWGTDALASSDYNTVMDNRFSADDENTTISLASWRGLGYDAHSIIATPDQLFVSEANQNYYLKIGSPALDAGETLADVTDDINGTVRPFGMAYDIGCYERAGHFPDVLYGTWDFESVEACVENGIVGGYPDGFYHPAMEVTRDQMAVFISRAMAGGDASVPDGPPTPSFPDVPNSGTTAWCYKYVEYCKAQNVVGGYPDGSYGPSISLDRGQMAVFIARGIAPYAERPDLPSYTPPGTPTFPDVVNSGTTAWMYKSVEYVHAAGVVGGYPDGWYHPEIACTRDQMAVFIARGFEYLP